MAISSILLALRDGPRTNAQLQQAVNDHGGAVARDCAKLIASGRVVRVGCGGRGKRATYALAVRP
ncbi:putative HTH transcriptional regulator [Sphingomonas vulcanisoli]|uniref:HTH transcriptional regulator n=1 Tax=Sphingomonas vulcanisoli TaxID=1658060 RepID=A0ABX0TSU1_9SPHN|nr:putative HTH transcriptional regulator [Sphingomonas vulcanisoli]